jgi:hydrogenase 3 maturation protease
MNFTHLTDRLSKYRNDKIVFVGLGNELRRDDLAGLVFINALKTKAVFNKSKFIIAGKNPENYLQEILESNPEAVVFIDAADWGGEPGDISFLEADSIASGDFSTHAYSIKLLEQFLLLNRQMDFVYIGIQPKTNELGKEMSLQVNQAIKQFFSADEQI